jgi:hypothetical protein
LRRIKEHRMNADTSVPRLQLLQRAARVDAAKARALALRDAEIDRWWHGLRQWLRAFRAGRG